MSDRHHEPQAAVAGTSMGGAMDLGVDEAETLEKKPGPDGAGGRGDALVRGEEGHQTDQESRSCPPEPHLT